MRLPRVARAAAYVAAGAAIAFLMILASLHLLKPDLDPTWRVISEYALGPYGWMMSTAFMALALASASLGVAAYTQVRNLGGYVGLVLLLVTAVGMVLAAVFVTDPVTTPAEAITPRHRLHILGAMLDSLPLAAPLVSYSISRDRRTDVAARRLRYLSWLPMLGTIIFFASAALFLPSVDATFGPDVLVGIPNRLMIVTHCAWIVLAARYLLQLPTAGPDAASAT